MKNCVIVKKGSRRAISLTFAVIFIFLAVVLTIGLEPRNAEAAIAVDSVSSAVLSSAGTSLTFSHTVGASGTNRLLVVGVSIRHDDSNYTISATYAGVTMISSGRSSRKEALSEIFYLAAPATGTNNVVITLSKSLVFGAGAISFTGADQVTPVGVFASANGDSTTPSVNVTGVNEGEVVIDSLATGDVQTTTLTVGAGQTQRWNTITTKTGKDADTFVAGSTEPGPTGGGTVTMEWTMSVAKKWALGALAIKPFIFSSGTIVVNSSQDTYMNATAKTTNYGASTTFSIEGENTRLKRALLLFDLSSVPASVTITSAILTLEKVGGDSIADTIGVYALTRSWAEGNSTAGSGATWNTYNGSSNWTTAGGDFNATPVASAMVTASTGPQNWDVTNLVRNWINGTLTNYGVLLMRNPEADGNMPIHNFSSREGTVAPKLTVTYSCVSGRVYADEGTTNIGAGKTVRLLVNGVSAGTAVTDSSGNYSIPASFSAGDAVLVYIDNDGAHHGTTATVAGAGFNISLDIYAGHLITHHDNGGVLTNANLFTAKGSYSDTDILYSLSGSALSVEGTSTVLYVPPTDSFSPGGNVTTPNMKSLGTFNGGNSTIDVNGTLSIIGGTFTASSGTTYVAGNLSISGATFNNNSGTMIFDGEDATISVGTTTLNNMTVDKTNYTLTMASSLTVEGNLTITSGILNQGASYDLTSGPVAIAADGTLRNRGTGSFTLSGNIANSGKIDFNGGGDDLCGSATKTLIRSSVNGAQRSWSGSGIFDMVDIDVKDQTGSASITVYAGTDSGNNGTNWTFNAGCTGAPTAVTLASFTAIDHNGDVLIKWRTGYEVNNLGFHVYREEDGKTERITPEIMAGSALLTAVHVPLRSGRSYMWVDSHDRKGSDVKYWLEDVDLSGKRTWHGPVMPEENSEPRPEWITPQYLSELSRNMDEQYEEYRRIQVLKKALRRRTDVKNIINGDTSTLEALALPQSTTKKLPTSDLELQWTIANQKTAKIYVKEAGWYRLSIGDLKAAGFRAVYPKHLRLYSEGREIPILVNSKKTGRLGVEDSIEFYGQETDSPSTDSRVYWLTKMHGSGARVSTQEGQGEQTLSTSFPFTAELRERMFYFAALRNGETENFFGAIVTAQPIDKILTISHLDPAPPGNAVLEVALQGVTESPHRVKVLVNNHEIGEVTFAEQAQGQAQLALPQPLLLEGDNLLTLAAQGGEMDVSLVDSVKLTYWHTYATSTDSLKLSAEGGRKVSIGGFTSPNIRVVDITDPASPIDVVGSVRGEGSRYSCTFGVPGEGAKTLLAFTEEKVKNPYKVVYNEPSKWHKVGNGFDVVIISHKDFLAGLEPLKKLRQSQRLRVALIDVEDLYDEFSFGKKAPQAIKDFLRHAKSTWRRPPRFVLLVGDASFDPRNYLGGGDYDFVPTKLVETTYLETASDDWFTDFDGDGLPEIAIGRLPVSTAEEATTVVSKILGYEHLRNNGNWRNQMLLIADENGEFDFESADEALRNLFPPVAVVNTVFRSQYADDEQAKNEIARSMNQGALLVNYIGHGSEETWGSNIFTSEDGKSLTNGLKLPFVIAMTCLNGYFHDIYTESLGEALLKAKQGGAIAVAASSGLTEPNGQTILNKELIRLLFRDSDEPLTLGEALLRAKSAVTDPDIRRTWMLFGDPATRLQTVLPEKVKVGRANSKISAH